MPVMPYIRESDTVKGVRSFLHIMECQGKLAWIRVSTTGIPTKEGRFRKNPDQVGCPDFIVWLANGPVIALEVKSTKGQLSDAQKDFQEKLEKLKHPYVIVRTIQDAVNAVQFFRAKL